jgi:cytosine/adenosine deaminase-related metal-dependent hydrolase
MTSVITHLGAFALTMFGSSTAFINVNVVPMDSQRVLRHQTVVVEGDTIAAIGATRAVSVPDDAQKIDGAGSKYLLPGLADMHTHVEDPSDLVLYTANGVTTILQMGSPTIMDMRRMRQIWAEQGLVGPHVYASFLLDGPTARGAPYAATPDDAREMVRMAKRHGYEFIKLYNSLSREQFLAIADEARKQRLGVVGHGVRAVGLPEGLFLGQSMVAHAEEFYYTAFQNREDEARIPLVVAETRRSGAYVTPNLSLFEAMTAQWGKPEQVVEYLADPRALAMSPGVRLMWMRDPRQRRSGDLTPALLFLRKLTKAMQEAGVPLLAGTDSPPIPGMYPGYSLHHDLRALRAAGLTNYQALVAATRAPGEFIVSQVPGAPRFGQLKVGMKADAVLVEGNPLDSLEVLERPVGVMTAGRWMTLQQLTEIVEAQKKTYQSLY